MTMLCPKDGSGCPDDMCRGSGCLKMDGRPMLTRCEGCGGSIDEEDSFGGTCTCDDDDIYMEDD